MAQNATGGPVRVLYLVPAEQKIVCFCLKSAWKCATLVKIGNQNMLRYALRLPPYRVFRFSQNDCKFSYVASAIGIQSPIE